jgi:hypothetical protein
MVYLITATLRELSKVAMATKPDHALLPGCWARIKSHHFDKIPPTSEGNGGGLLELGACCHHAGQPALAAF